MEYKDTVDEIFEYVFREMTDPGGGFNSAEDADSEGEEGRYYIWNMEEMQEVLNPTQLQLASELFSLNEKGNFHDPHKQTGHGGNILHIQPAVQVPIDANESTDSTTKILMNGMDSIRRKLFDERRKRVRPGKDDKILTDWNGLMIAALARAARILGTVEYSEAAEKAVGFIMEHLRDENGRLLHRYRNRDANIPGNLDDYAFLIWGLIELYLTTFTSHYLGMALELNEMMITHFRDPDGGGFFFIPDDGERLLVRRKEYYDGAVPSGNSVAMYDLIVLGRITGRADLEGKAADLQRSIAGEIRKHPMGYMNLMMGVDLALGPSQEIIITGDPEDEATREMIESLRKMYLPHSVVILNPLTTGGNEPEIWNYAGYLKNYGLVDGKATAYVCGRYTCKKPTTDVRELLQLVKSDHET